MKKKEYMKPAMRVVLLQHHQQLLAGSLKSVQSTGLPSEDAVLINTEEVGTGFWGR